MKKLSSGFTLIELLIVIAVLGILAVAVLSAINPIEQINRSRDTSFRSDAEQLLGAIDRFYAATGYAPWKISATVPAATDAVAWGLVTAYPWVTGGQADVLGVLSTSGTAELKGSFVTRISGTGYGAPLYRYQNAAAGSSLYLCFKPLSGSFQTEAWVRCGTNGAGLPADLQPMASTICVAAAGGNYSCLP